MAKEHTRPITVRFNSATRQRLINRAEKQSQTASDVVRSIVADHLAGNDLEHRIRVAVEEVLKRTRQEIGETVQQTVQEAILFVIQRQASEAVAFVENVHSATPKQSAKTADPLRKVYNRTLLIQGRYDDEITAQLEAEAERRAAANPNRHKDDFILQLLNDGWKPGNWSGATPMRVPG